MNQDASQGRQLDETVVNISKTILNKEYLLSKRAPDKDLSY